MVQGFHTFLILCVTGAIHLHSAWGLPSDGFYSCVQKVRMSQLFYTFPILCVTGAIDLHSAWGRPSEFQEFLEIRKCGNLEIKEFLSKSIKSIKNIKKYKIAETFIKKYKINTLESFYVDRISRFSGNSEFGDFRDINSLISYLCRLACQDVRGLVG